MSDPRIHRRASANVQRIANALDNQMAYSRNSSLRSYRRYRRRYSSYGRSYRGRSRGQFSAANGQRDTSRSVLKWSHVQQIKTRSITVGEGDDVVVSTQGLSYFNAWKALASSGFFQSLADMYDQVKLNAIKVKITLLSANQSIYSNNANPVFVSAWDRNGLPSTSNREEPFKFVSSYGSAVTKALTVGANFGMQRYLYASTMAEKSQYIPTSKFTQKNVAEDIYLSFNPALLLAIYSDVTTNTEQTLSFNVEWQFDVTFRGTRNDPNASP